jgi:DNA-binding GntR family transcriptional regulator
MIDQNVIVFLDVRKIQKSHGWTHFRMIQLKSDLQEELVTRILGLLRSPSAVPLERMREAVLSRELGVSRTPIRAALQHLVRVGVLEPHPHGGYTRGTAPPTIRTARSTAKPGVSLYGRIVRDIILNDMPEPASGKFLERRYSVGKGELSRVLRRLMREGLAEPSAGRGWRFMHFDAGQISRSYHLRIVLEPAIMLDRHFSMNPESLIRMKDEQQAALNSLGPNSLWPELFELDASLHETLAQGSGNELVAGIIRQQNNFRRLAEFFSYSRLDRIGASITEHIAILDALIAGDRRWASELMRQHLKESQRQTEEHIQHDLDTVRRASSGIEML